MEDGGGGGSGWWATLSWSGAERLGCCLAGGKARLAGCGDGLLACWSTWARTQRRGVRLWGQQWAGRACRAVMDRGGVVSSSGRTGTRDQQTAVLLEVDARRRGQPLTTGHPASQTGREWEEWIRARMAGSRERPAASRAHRQACSRRLLH